MTITRIKEMLDELAASANAQQQPDVTEVRLTRNRRGEYMMHIKMESHVYVPQDHMDDILAR